MNCENKDKIHEINEKLQGATPEEVLGYFMSNFPGKVKLASSLGLEDQVLTHMIVTQNLGIGIFTLDTGRLFQETYSLIDRTRERYGITIEIVFPNRDSVEKMVREHGTNLFYESTEKRKLCCRVRKIEPSRLVLDELDAWITGMRGSQSVTRRDLSVVEWDQVNCLINVNPLANWSMEEVRAYIRENNIPYNPLHDKGFPSIGCIPCTRAVQDGEDIRSGRWWWENADKKECGLHVNRK